MNSDVSPGFLGQEIKEPVYGAPARWIDKSGVEDASLQGLTVVTPYWKRLPRPVAFMPAQNLFANT